MFFFKIGDFWIFFEKKFSILHFLCKFPNFCVFSSHMLNNGFSPLNQNQKLNKCVLSCLSEPILAVLVVLSCCWGENWEKETKKRCKQSGQNGRNQFSSAGHTSSHQIVAEFSRSALEDFAAHVFFALAELAGASPSAVYSSWTTHFFVFYRFPVECFSISLGSPAIFRVFLLFFKLNPFHFSPPSLHMPFSSCNKHLAPVSWSQFDLYIAFPLFRRLIFDSGAVFADIFTRHRAISECRQGNIWKKQRNIWF